MRTLIWAEGVKLMKQSKTYYALGAVFLIECLIFITAYYQGSNILDVLLDSLKQSFYFEGTLLNGNLILYIVLNGLWFNVPLIIMIITSGILTDEYKDGTMQTTLLQAVHKGEFIGAKYIVAVGFTLFVIAFMMVTSGILAYSIFGKGDLIVYLQTLNFFPAADAFRRICWAFASGALAMLFYSVVSMTLAVWIKEAAKTWIASALFLIITNLLLKLDLGIVVANHFFFPKLMDTWQAFFYNEINWNVVWLNNTVLLGYDILLIGLGVWTFRKQDIG